MRTSGRASPKLRAASSAAWHCRASDSDVYKRQVLAIIVGMGILPIMATVLVLILFESETLYHANQAKLPAWIVALHPNPPEIPVIEEVKPHYYD